MASSPAPAAPKQLQPYLFKPGQSGNPAGREKGSRNKLGEDFVAAMQKDFAEHGEKTIERARNSDPVAYLNVIARVIPKEVIHTVRDYDDLSDDELNSLAVDLARHLLGIDQGASGAGQAALPPPMSDEPPLVIGSRPEPE